MCKRRVLTVLTLLCLSTFGYAQVSANRSVLAKTATDHRNKQVDNLKKALALVKEKGWAASFKTKENGIAFLMGVNDLGLPIYYSTENNTIAAATTGVNKLWTGLGLSGSMDALKGKVGVWDESTILGTHQELAGRVLYKDGASAFSDHSTHVAGTIIASGVNPLAKGMAYGAQQLVGYDFYNDESEMSAEAAGLLLSNHSYGEISGWYYNSDKTRWEFMGKWGDNEDYKFGYYDLSTQMFDSISYNAPYYLIVKAAGNNRSQTGPAVGQPYYRYDASGAMVNAGNRGSDMSSNNSYDILPTYATAKNIMTVGAVYGINNGYSKSSDVIMSSFSSWGPTDDGRIKPDIVADGVSVLSSTAGGNDTYASLNGTSMATPNVTGSLLLLQEYYAKLNGGNFMRAATLKGLAIHTADEAGDAPGPDYRFGWGLLDVAKGADVIKSNNAGTHRIYEKVLNSGETYTTTVVASGAGPLVATISWTDPKGSVDFTNLLNNKTPKLVNDLDIRVIAGTNTYMPWILDPANPTNAATTGDNYRDNVERINIDNPIPGMTYTIVVSHKNTLARGSQAYSLFLSGAGGQAYCASAPTNTTGARIDSVAFAGIKKINTAGCTGYSDFRQTFAYVEPNQTLPLTVKVGSCDVTNSQKVVKAYIDFNNNGSFADAGEEVAASGVITGEGTFTATVSIPATVTVGNATIMRIVLQEAGDATAVSSCGVYGNGETQDYRLIIANPANDLSALELSAPGTISCSNTAQTIALKIKNNGRNNMSGFPVSVDVKSGGNTVASYKGTYPGAIYESAIGTYTIPLSFNAVAGSTYTVVAVVKDNTDQLPFNDTLVTTIKVADVKQGPLAEANVCGSTSNLKVKNPSSASQYFWYDNTDLSKSPIGSGSTLNTYTIPQNNTYYVSSGFNSSVGLKSNTVYANGGGYLSGTSNFMRYNSAVPLTLESVRLYSKYGGTVNIVICDITSQTTTSFTYRAISTTSVDVFASSPVQEAGSVPNYDAADTGFVYNLNIALPQGDHAIMVQTQGSVNLFRNNNVTGNPYPFGVPGVINFYGNSATDANNADFFQGFYYFLYDMKVRTAECLTNRTTVVATVSPTPVITMSNDSLTTNVDGSLQWYLNGIPVQGGTTKQIKPTQGGDYTVLVTDAYSCQRVSNAFNYTITALDPVVNIEAGLKIAPNPSRGLFNLSITLKKREDLGIEIFNGQGQTVYAQSWSKQMGSFSKLVDLQNQSSGAYILKITHGSDTYYQKIMIQK
jgi:hypothetical protein